MKIARGRRSHEEAQRSYELAAAARDYSRRAKSRIDDKLTFAAALMRAGETQGAADILDQLETDLHEEGESLRRATAPARRKAPVRARLATTMAGIALVGTSMLGASAAGLAAAGAFSHHSTAKLGLSRAPATKMVEPRQMSKLGPNHSSASKDAGSSQRDANKRMKIDGVSFALSGNQQRRFEKLTSQRNVDGQKLTSLLQQVLPNADARKVNDVLTKASGTVDGVTDAVKTTTTQTTSDAKHSTSTAKQDVTSTAKQVTSGATKSVGSQKTGVLGTTSKKTGQVTSKSSPQPSDSTKTSSTKTSKDGPLFGLDPSLP